MRFRLAERPALKASPRLARPFAARAFAPSSRGAAAVVQKYEVSEDADPHTMAAGIHREAGGSNQSATAVGKSAGRLYVASQLPHASVSAVIDESEYDGTVLVDTTQARNISGAHAEVQMFLRDWKPDAVGASKHVCMWCQRVVEHADGMSGLATNPDGKQTTRWKSPEYLSGQDMAEMDSDRWPYFRGYPTGDSSLGGGGTYWTRQDLLNARG